MALAMPAAGLLSPLWIYYRRMQFVRQRALQAIDPLVSFVVTVALAVAGAGYWSLVIGAVAGTWSAALVIFATSPYRPRLRLDGGVRDYVSFSWPLVVANVNRLVVVQAPILVGEWQVGLAAAGAITLAGSVIAFTQKVDAMITQTIYPAVCAVADKTELLFETFVKSNRLVLIWGVPFGISLLLFAPDLVNFVLGHKWQTRGGSAPGLWADLGLQPCGLQLGCLLPRARGNQARCRRGHVLDHRVPGGGHSSAGH